MLYEALGKVLRNHSDAPVFLGISKWCITITTTSNISLKLKTRRSRFRSVQEHVRLVQMYP